ncbi:cytochrome P450 [Nonomuraea endophytica]|uniref:cytochrome P450 n=1 Tax=Nonomuraea endophytica TaxID=714136 RepID=UPI0037CBDFFA
MTEPALQPAPALGFPARVCPYDPPHVYAEHRRHGPVAKVFLPDGKTGWLVTGYHELRSLLADRRISADRGSPVWPNYWEGPGESWRSPLALRAAHEFNLMDGHQHAALRRVVLPYLTARRARALAPAIDRAVNTLIERMLDAGPPTDVVPALAMPLPAMMMAEVFAIPSADHAFFVERVTRAFGSRAFDRESIGELGDYLARQIREREGGAGDDLITGVASHLGQLNRQSLERTVQVIVSGAYEPVSSAISIGTLVLLANPPQLAALRANLSLMPAAVEELLRYMSTFEPVQRVAVADIHIAGQVIRAGEAVLLSPASANRDATVFADPDSFTMGRSAHRHVAFGEGTHMCVGKNLAKVALESVFTGLLSRLPGLRPVGPVDTVGIDPAAGSPRITPLLVTW